MSNATLQRDAGWNVKCYDSNHKLNGNLNSEPGLPRESHMADFLDMDVGTVTSCLKGWSWDTQTIRQQENEKDFIKIIWDDNSLSLKNLWLIWKIE